MLPIFYLSRLFMKRKWFFIGFTYIILSVGALNAQSIKASEDSLFAGFQRLRAAKSLTQKVAINDSLRTIFRRVLQQNESFRHSFDTLNTVGKIMSPDEAFRIINWNITHPDGTNSYYAFLQFYHEDKNKIVLTELTDMSERMDDPEQQIVGPEQWYGALYYQIVPSDDRKRNHYLLLGWDGADLLINRKVIDVLSFTSSGKPKFGKSVFQFGKERKKRVVFEFSYMATMRLFYDPDIGMVVFEHMVPVQSAKKDIVASFGSDLTFDGLEYEDGKWILRENLDVKNKNKMLNKRKKDISYTF
jgi:hypothetical protein